MANNPLRSRSTTSQPSRSRSSASDVDRRRAVRNAPANSSGGVNTAFGTRPVTPLEELDLAPHRLFGRFVSQGIKSVDPILRGLYAIGKSAYQGLEKPIFSGMDAVGLDVGSYGEKVLETESMGPEIAKEFARSFFLETPSALADLSYVPNLIFSGPEAAGARLGGRLQEISDEPFMFGLEHVGNAAIAGATVAKPLQLGIASSRGALTPAAARGGMMPVTGRGARVTARHATRQAAEEGSRLAKTAEILDDVVGHPYLATGRKIRDSYPGQLVRNPMSRERIFGRISEGLRGRMDELVQNEEGSLTFRKGDPRREYNDLFVEIAKLNNRIAGYPEGHPIRREVALERMHLENRQNQLARELRSQGIDVDGFQPLTIEGVDPSELVAERDFTFDEGGGTFSADGFWQSMSGPLRRKLMRTGQKVEPDTVDFEPHVSSTLDEPSADFYKTNAEGEVVGVMSVYPDDIHVAVHPAYRRQGIAKQMVEKALEAGVPLERIVTSPNSGVSTSQYGTVLLEWGRQAMVENPGRFRNNVLDPRFDRSGPIGSMDDTAGYMARDFDDVDPLDAVDDLDLDLQQSMAEANDLDELRRQMPGASDAEILRAYQRSRDIQEGRAPRDWEIPAEEAELVAEFQRRMPHLSMAEINRLMDQYGDAALDVITEEMSGPSRSQQISDATFDDLLSRGGGRESTQARPDTVRGETRNPDRPDMPIEVMENGAFRNPRTGEYFDSHSEALDSVYRESTDPMGRYGADPVAREQNARNRVRDYYTESEEFVFHGTDADTAASIDHFGTGLDAGGLTRDIAEAQRYAGDDGVVLVFRRSDLPGNLRGGRVEQFYSQEELAYLRQYNPDALEDTAGRAVSPEGLRPYDVVGIEDVRSGVEARRNIRRWQNEQSEAEFDLDDPMVSGGLTNLLAPENNRVTVSTRQLRNMGVNVFDLARERPDFAQRRASVIQALDEGLIEPEVSIRVRETPNGGLAFQLDDGTHRFYAAEDGLLRDELIVNFVTDAQGTPARGNLLQRAREVFTGWSEDAVTGTRAAADNQGPTQRRLRNEYDARADDLLDEMDTREAATGRNPLEILEQDAPFDRNNVPTAEQLMDPNFEPPPQSQEAIAGRELLDALGDLLRSEEGSIALFGPGRQKIGNRIGLVDFTANEVGLALRKILDSPGFERAFGPDAKMSRFIRSDFIKSITHGDGVIANQLEELISEQVGNINLQRRWDPARTEQLFMRDLDNLAKRPDAAKYTDLIADFEGDRPTLRTAPKRAGQVLIGDSTLGMHHTPEMLVRRVDRVLRYAREASNGDQAILDATLRDLLPGVEPMGMYLMALNGIERLKGLPDNSLTGALGDYVSMDRFGELNRRAQQALGNRAEQVTGERFSLPPEALGVDLTTLPAEHQKLFHEAAAQYRQELGRQREPLLLSEGVIRTEAGSRAGLAADQPTRFSSELDDLPLDPSTRSKVDTTRKAVEEQQIRLSAARQEHMAREQARLDAGMKLLDDLESSVLTDPANAPVAARNLLVYANEVAPRQARALRQMAEEGVGDPKVLEGLAKELESMPRTLEELNDADVYLAYLKDIKDVGKTEPSGIGVRQGINTRNPARRRGTATDISYSRDFRSRAYWQDSEFQAYFMSRQADELVKSKGLAKTGRERLREAGWSDEAIDKLSTNRVQQELERLRLRSYDPSKLFPSGRKPPQGVDPLDARWVHPWVENNLLTAIKEPSNFERILQGTYDPLLKGWKVFALPLRLAWQLNNYAGSSLLTMLHGKVSPMDYASLMRASYKAVQDYNRGIPSQISFPLKDSYRAELVAKLNTLDAADPQHLMIKKMLDEGRINLTNEVLGDIAQNGLLRGDFAFLRNSQFAQDVGARPKSIFKQYGVDLTLPENLGGEALRLGSRVRNVKASGRQIVDFSYHVNSTVDNMHRTMIYLDQIGKGASPEQALSQMAKTLGDYSKLSPFERTWVKRIYPFWPWMRHITGVVADAFKPQNMTRAVIFAHIMSIFGEPNEWEEMLPEYAQGHIFMGLDENGKPKFLSTRGLNPFLDVFDPVGQPNLQGIIRPMAPPFQYLYEKLSGTSVLTGRPISSPTGDPEARPPLSEYFFRNIPQAGVARDIYRDMTDQPLTRYGTGEPAFFQGATERSGGDSLRQLFGLNIRSIDVESQQNAERVREYNMEVRRRRHEAQENSQGGRSLTDLLDSLPGLGGGSQSSGSRSNPLR